MLPRRDLKCSDLVIAVVFLGIGSAQAATLSDAQKSTVLETFQSLALATAIPDTLNSNLKSGARPGQDPVSLKFVELGAAMTASGCQGNNSQIADSQSGAILDQAFSVSGNSCVLAYREEERDNPVDGSRSSTMQFQVNNESYAALNDVSGVSLATQVSFQAVPGHGLTLTLTGNGLVSSQALGALPITVNGMGVVGTQYESLQVEFDFEFPGYVAQLVETSTYANSAQTLTYSLNGQTLSSDEVNTYITLPFAPGSTSLPAAAKFLRIQGH